MKIILGIKVHGFIRAAAFFAGLSFGSSAAAQIPSYLVDLNSKTVTDLGTLGGSTVNASGINDAGQVVGRSYTSDGVSHAFITGPNGEGIIDLNSLFSLPHGIVLSEARDINNAGQIIAMGIPEPESYAMFLAGLGLIGLMARRRRARV